MNLTQEYRITVARGPKTTVAEIVEPGGLFSPATGRRRLPGAGDMSTVLDIGGAPLGTGVVAHGDHDEERCPRCARLPRVCSHGIYHHGCPSCDRQDPEVSP